MLITPTYLLQSQIDLSFLWWCMHIDLKIINCLWKMYMFPKDCSFCKHFDKCFDHVAIKMKYLTIKILSRCLRKLRRIECCPLARKLNALSIGYISFSKFMRHLRKLRSICKNVGVINIVTQLSAMIQLASMNIMIWF